LDALVGDHTAGGEEEGADLTGRRWRVSQLVVKRVRMVIGGWKEMGPKYWA
jgi:hypothetical protein